jgi:hypothetical protein
MNECRIQFDVIRERLAELNQLMSFCDLKTRKDLFDNAMTLFEWAVHEVRAGKEIASYNRNTEHVEVIRLPVLDNAARRAKSRPIELVTADGVVLPREAQERSATDQAVSRRKEVARTTSG